MLDKNTPVLIAQGQVTERPGTMPASTPVELIARAVELAIADSGSHTVMEQIDIVASTGLTVDAEQVRNPLSNSYKNVPYCVAKKAGFSAGQYYYCATGGNSPQFLVNHFANKIAAAETKMVVICGGEALHNMFAQFTPWWRMWRLFTARGNWRDKSGGHPILIGDNRAGHSPLEGQYELDLPAHVYPLFENALAHHYRRSSDEQRDHICQLFADFSSVAQQNDYAWFQNAHSAQALRNTNAHNRMIAFPYSKLLNSMILVNQAACLILTSVGKAEQLGIDPAKWVFLHGGADGQETWQFSQRRDFHSAPVLGRCFNAVLSQAEKSIEQIEFLDLYSCFPSAVQIACDQLGLSHQHRPLTLTGGLPYFGGAGNAYSLFAIAAAIKTLRQNRQSFAMINANGWYLTKHAVGIYSCKEPAKPFSQTPVLKPEPKEQHAVPPLLDEAAGRATIETFTTLYDKDNKPSKAIIIGRTETQTRFISYLQGNEFEQLNQQGVGASGQVQTKYGLNRFTLD